MPHKRALVREKQNTLFSLARPRKLLRLTAAAREIKIYCSKMQNDKYLLFFDKYLLTFAKLLAIIIHIKGKDGET